MPSRVMLLNSAVSLSDGKLHIPAIAQFFLDVVEASGPRSLQGIQFTAPEVLRKFSTRSRDDVYRKLKFLADTGFLCQQKVRDVPYKTETPYTVNVYNLTPKGIEFIEDLRRIGELVGTHEKIDRTTVAEGKEIIELLKRLSVPMGVIQPDKLLRKATKPVGDRWV